MHVEELVKIDLLTRRTVTIEGEETVEGLHFFYDAQSRPAMVEYGGQLYSYLHNLQGDIIGIVDAAGNLVVEYRYDAWGKPIYETGSLLSSLGHLNPFRYRGYVWDEETELLYIRTRFYNGSQNRFISADVIVDHEFFKWKDNRNIYAYCYNSPCVNKDADGTGPILAFIGNVIGGAVVNVVSNVVYEHATGGKYNWRENLVKDLVIGAGTSFMGSLGMLDDCFRVFSQVAEAGLNALSAGVQYWEDCKDNSIEVDPGTMIAYTMSAGIFTRFPISTGGEGVAAKILDDVIPGVADSVLKGVSSHTYQSNQKKKEDRTSLSTKKYDPLKGCYRKLAYDPLLGYNRWIYMYA